MSITSEQALSAIKDRLPDVDNATINVLLVNTFLALYQNTEHLTSQIDLVLAEINQTQLSGSSENFKFNLIVFVIKYGFPVELIKFVIYITASVGTELWDSINDGNYQKFHQVMNESIKNKKLQLISDLINFIYGYDDNPNLLNQISVSSDFKRLLQIKIISQQVVRNEVKLTLSPVFVSFFDLDRIFIEKLAHQYDFISPKKEITNSITSLLHQGHFPPKIAELVFYIYCAGLDLDQQEFCELLIEAPKSVPAYKNLRLFLGNIFNTQPGKALLAVLNHNNGGSKLCPEYYYDLNTYLKMGIMTKDADNNYNLAPVFTAFFEPEIAKYLNEIQSAEEIYNTHTMKG